MEAAMNQVKGKALKPRTCYFCRKSGNTTPLFATWIPPGERSIYAHPKCFRRAANNHSVACAKPLDLSSWIEDIRYRRFPDGRAYLGIFLRPEPGSGTGTAPVALLYGPEIPSWLPGLVQAGAGKRSVGRAYNRLVKGKFPFQRVTGQDVIALKEMLK